MDNIYRKIRLKNKIMTLSGTFISAAALVFFLIPFDIAPGGVSGVASVICYVTDNRVSVGLMILLINIPLFIAGWKYLGKSFFAESFFGTVMFSVMIDLLNVFSKNVGEFIYGGPDSVNKLVCAIWGGTIMGAGLGVVFKSGATTGGTDIIVKLFMKKYTSLSSGGIVMYIDVFIILIIAITYQSFEAALYSGIAVFVSSKTIDIFEAGINYARKVIIITNEPDQISSIITSELMRGVTKIDAVGMYAQSEVSVLMCVIHKGQLNKLQNIIGKYAPESFVVISDVRSVIGDFRKTKN